MSGFSYCLLMPGRTLFSWASTATAPNGTATKATAANSNVQRAADGAREGVDHDV